MLCTNTQQWGYIHLSAFNPNNRCHRCCCWRTLYRNNLNEGLGWRLTSILLLLSQHFCWWLSFTIFLTLYLQCNGLSWMVMTITILSVLPWIIEIFQLDCRILISGSLWCQGWKLPVHLQVMTDMGETLLVSSHSSRNYYLVKTLLLFNYIPSC